MSTLPASQPQLDAWSFGPDRTDLLDLLRQALLSSEFDKAFAADCFTSLYANGDGIADWAILQYRHYSSMVSAYRNRLSQLSQLIFKD